MTPIMVNPSPKKVCLYLVATPIGNLQEMTPRAIQTLKEVDLIACEDTRTSFPLLQHFDIHTKTVAYHNFNEEESSKGLLKELSEGKNVAVISDAGYPLISDPGYQVVQRAIENGFEVIPISGPNAGVNALVASGLDTNHYLFYGFLSSKDSEARKELKELNTFPYTMIFYEAPHRILRTLRLALEVLGDRKAVVVRELTKLHEEKSRGLLSELIQRENYRGEIVLLIEGRKNETVYDEDILLKMVDDSIDEGMPLKKACAAVAEMTGVAKNDLYRLYIQRKAQS